MNEYIQAIIDFLLYIPRQIYAWITDGLASMLESLTPPLTSADITAALNGVGGDVLFFLTMFEFKYGLTAVFGAYVARFILRRIPGIG